MTILSTQVLSNFLRSHGIDTFNIQSTIIAFKIHLQLWSVTFVVEINCGNLIWLDENPKGSHVLGIRFSLSFVYFQETHQILNPITDGIKCLSIDITTQTLSMEDCVENDIRQKWNWGEKNLTALSSWENFGVELTSLKI